MFDNIKQSDSIELKDLISMFTDLGIDVTISNISSKWDGVIFPCLLKMNDGSVIMLHTISTDENQVTASLVEQSGVGLIQKKLPLDSLLKKSSGLSLHPKVDNYVAVINDPYFEKQPPKHWLWVVLKQFRHIYIQVAVAALVINIFALISPLFVMNVYDRVIPNYAMETLWVLAIGVFIALIFDFILKLIRSYFLDYISKNVDIELSTKLYLRNL